MMCTRLEVRVHIVTASSSATQNLVTAVNRAGVHVDDTIFEPLACADSVLRSDERELGVCLVDLGAGSCDLIVFSRVRLRIRRSFPSEAITLPAIFRSACARGWRTRRRSRKILATRLPTLIPKARSRSAVGGRPAVAHDVTAVGR